MVFCFVQNFFFGQDKSSNIYFFLSRKARIFFPEFNIRLYDKNSESHYFFFLHQNQNIFFSNIGNRNIFLEKNHNPPPLQVKWSFPYRTNVYRCKKKTQKKFDVTILTQDVIGILDLWNASTYLSISQKILSKSSNSTYHPHRPIVRKIRYISHNLCKTLML